MPFMCIVWFYMNTTATDRKVRRTWEFLMASAHFSSNKRRSICFDNQNFLYNDYALSGVPFYGIFSNLFWFTVLEKRIDFITLYSCHRNTYSSQQPLSISIFTIGIFDYFNTTTMKEMNSDRHAQTFWLIACFAFWFFSTSFAICLFSFQHLHEAVIKSMLLWSINV